jgi:hypothetical protein
MDYLALLDTPLSFYIISIALAFIFALILNILTGLSVLVGTIVIFIILVIVQLSGIYNIESVYTEILKWLGVSKLWI